MALQKHLGFFLIGLSGITAAFASYQSTHPKHIDSLYQNGNTKAAVKYALQNAYSLYSENLEKADSIFAWVVNVSHSQNWPEQKAYGHLYQGITYYLDGQYPQAHRNYYQALAAFDSLGSDSGKGRTYNELGVFYHKTDETKKAFAVLDSAYHFCRKAGDIQGMGTAQEHRASFLFRQQKYAEAKPYIDEVLEIREKQQDSVGLSYVYLNLAEYYTATKAYEEALKMVRRSTHLRKALGDTQGVIVNAVITGEIWMSRQDYGEAIKHLKNGQRRAHSIGYTDLERYAAKMLEKCYVALNNYQEAYAYVRESARIKDSLFNLEKARAVSELETQYETERKEQKIALQEAELSEQDALLERNTIFMAALALTVLLLVVIYFLARYRFRKKRELMQREQELRLQKTQIEATLRSQEEERKRVARDLHDGFGQLLSTLRMHLDAADEHLQQATPPSLAQAEKLLDQMHKEIRRSAFNLMPQVLIQGGLMPALQELAARLNEAGRLKVAVTAYAMEQRLPEQQEVALYRIVQEWLTNVVKYAEARSIQVQLVRHEDELSITIEDDGWGFDPSTLEKGKGNGWRNIQLRLQMIQATGEVDSRPDMAGTTFMIHCPLLEIHSETSKNKSVATLS